MPQILLAIDPGKTGAMAWVTEGDGHLIEVADMPTIEVRGKHRINAAELVSLMDKRPLSRVIIEGVSSRPGEGVAGAFSFGYSAGLLEGVAAAIGRPVEIIQASVWKRRAGVPADKGAARMMASRLWPGCSDRFKRVKDDGRAESALLGRWAATRNQ
jgi:crossover junction endodeoxyribonuclease RuvC